MFLLRGKKHTYLFASLQAKCQGENAVQDKKVLLADIFHWQWEERRAADVRYGASSSSMQCGASKQIKSGLFSEYCRDQSHLRRGRRHVCFVKAGSWIKARQRLQLSINTLQIKPRCATVGDEQQLHSTTCIVGNGVTSVGTGRQYLLRVICCVLIVSFLDSLLGAWWLTESIWYNDLDTANMAPHRR